MKFKNRRKSGQILILVLLVVVVALAVGLSVASRNITNLKTSTQAEQSQRAFTAAEGGVEDVLSKLNTVAGVIGGTADPANKCIKVSGQSEANCTLQNASTTTGVAGTVNVVASTSYTKTVEPGDVAQVNLNPTADTTAFTVEWGTDADKSSSETASMEFTLVCSGASSCPLTALGQSSYPVPTTVTGNYSQTRVAFADVNDNSHGTDQTGFQNCAAGTAPYHCRVTFTLGSGNFLLLRMKPFWNRATMKVQATVLTLPVQTYSITSVATTDTGVSRRVEVQRDALPQLPAIFDYVLYSGGDIIK